MSSRVLRIQRISHAIEPLPQSSHSLRRFQCLQPPSTAQFSTTTPKCRRDNNPMRGLSAMRATGLRGKRISVKKRELPEPVWDPAKRSVIETDPDHGLWGFFNKEKTLITTPDEDSSHGRSSHLIQHHVT
jgi:large subunit ribosomal protein L47